MPAAKDSESAENPVSKQATDPAKAVPPSRPRSRRKRLWLLWTLFCILIIAFLWLATSSSPFAEGFQGLTGNKHDQSIVDHPFSVSPHNFRYYKFALPDGSTKVAVVGDFSATPDVGIRKNDTSAQTRGSDDGIEVYVLNESSFAIWQTGYATSPVFESGRVAKGKVQGDLPAGPGVYYLVFSNRFSTRTAKKVDATVVLHYKSWMPEWLRRMKSDWW